MVGGMVLLFVIVFVIIFFKLKFIEVECKFGLINYIMGVSFIIEGVILFVVVDLV